MRVELSRSALLSPAFHSHEQGQAGRGKHSRPRWGYCQDLVMLSVLMLGTTLCFRFYLEFLLCVNSHVPLSFHLLSMQLLPLPNPLVRV